VRSFLTRHVSIEGCGLGCVPGCSCALNALLGVFENFFAASAVLTAIVFALASTLLTAPATAWATCCASNPLAPKAKAAAKTNSFETNLECMVRVLPAALLEMWQRLGQGETRF
jgi:hypothetical protein